MGNQGRVLIVEDLPNWQELLKRTLATEDLQVDVATSFSEAISKLEQNFYHLAVLDVRLVDQDASNNEGMTILDRLQEKRLGDAMSKIMISAYGTLAQMRNAFKQHKVADFIAKEDFDRTQFRQTVRKVFHEEVRNNFALKMILEDSLTYEELLGGIEVDRSRLKKDDPNLPRAIAEMIDLLQKLFYTADSIIVSRISHKSSVHSGATVIRVQPYYPDKHGEPVVVKISDYHTIYVEYENFERYVKGFIGGNRATNVLNLRRTPWLGGIVYSLLGAGRERLEDFSTFYTHHAPEAIVNVIDQLFENTCANWYANRGVVQHCLLTQEYQARLSNFAKLEQALKDNFPSLVKQKTISFREAGKKSLINPVYAIQQMAFTRATYQSVTHGDLNGNNILIDSSGQSWLIDFATTGKGHILRDLIELESTIKFFLLDSKELGARAALEEALATMSYFSDARTLTYVPPDIQFTKAYKAVIQLRIIAGRFVHPSDDFNEYQIGLLYTTLNVLRFYNLPKLNRQHALISAALISEKLGLQA